MDLLMKLGLKDREASSADKISLGQTKRVAIARAVRAGARILFLDEPLSGLDEEGIEEVLALLSSLVQRERLTLVIVEHAFNISRILNLAHTVWTLSDGKIQIDTKQNVSVQIHGGFDGMAQKIIDTFTQPGCQIHEQILYGGARLIKIPPLLPDKSRNHQFWTFAQWLFSAIVVWWSGISIRKVL